MSHANPPTWIASLTPPGQAALATLALHGPHSWEVVQGLFHLHAGGELPASPVAGRFWLGRAGAEMADEVVLAVKRVEPVPWLELHTHGGLEVVRYLLDLFIARGLQVCTWQEFLGQTETDGLRAAAAIALASAPTVRTAAILLDQYHGALTRALTAVLAALDRDEEIAAGEQLADLACQALLGRHLTVPWRVVIAGAPNVGKSSLVNALAGYQRSIVAATPGTTRDVVTTRIALDGWPVELADTAGLRAGAESLEEEGIRRARAMTATADLCLVVLDASTVATWPVVEAHTVHRVINKVDLTQAWDLRSAGDAIHVSAQTEAGLGDLCAALVRWLVPAPPPSGAAVPFTAGLCDGVVQAQRHLLSGQRDEARCVVESLLRTKVSER